jgi:pimeloyl-ACP methyl ester carboxylesterase
VAELRIQRERLRLWLVGGTAILAVVSVFSAVAGNAWDAGPPLLRIATRIPAAARSAAHPLVLTLGGPVYCGQALPLARYLGATLVCPDYGLNGERSAASRARRVEDWGDPKYLDAVARAPRELTEKGLHISELILVGASYAGYAAAELAATHPELHPRALIVVDSFLDLPERFTALHPGQPTRAEMIRVLGGTPAQRPSTYEQRSPSDHLAGLAAAMRHGMRLLDVWSVAEKEAREFNGGMCTIRSNAYWLRRLSRILHHPVTGYVTELRHAVALWDWWRQLLALAHLAPAEGALPATPVTFRAGRPIPSASYCGDTRGTIAADLLPH